MTDNPQVQGIAVAPINVEVWGIEPQEQEGKAIYPLQLECHNSSCLCTKQFKVTREAGLMQGSKRQQNSTCKSVPILYDARGQDKGFYSMETMDLGSWVHSILSLHLW